jgi:hypothetical protein
MSSTSLIEREILLAHVVAESGHRLLADVAASDEPLASSSVSSARRPINRELKTRVVIRRAAGLSPLTRLDGQTGG